MLLLNFCTIQYLGIRLKYALLPHFSSFLARNLMKHAKHRKGDLDQSLDAQHPNTDQLIQPVINMYKNTLILQS